jgi:hypothetical protein
MSKVAEKEKEKKKKIERETGWSGYGGTMASRALKALSALSQSNLTTHGLGLGLGTRPKDSNTTALGLPEGATDSLVHLKPPKRRGGRGEISQEVMVLARLVHGFRHHKEH